MQANQPLMFFQIFSRFVYTLFCFVPSITIGNFVA